MPKTTTDPVILAQRKKARHDYQRRYYQAHKEKAKEYQREYTMRYKKKNGGKRKWKSVDREFRPMAFCAQALIKLPAEKCIVIISRIIRGETSLVRSAG